MAQPEHILSFIMPTEHCSNDLHTVACSNETITRNVHSCYPAASSWARRNSVLIGRVITQRLMLKFRDLSQWFFKTVLLVIHSVEPMFQVLMEIRPMTYMSCSIRQVLGSPSTEHIQTVSTLHSTKTVNPGSKLLVSERQFEMLSIAAMI